MAYLLYLFCHTTSAHSPSNTVSIERYEIFFFLSLVILIIPILYWVVLHTLLKLDNEKKQKKQNNERFLGNPHLKTHLISVWKTHAEICWQWCLRSSCVANSLLFYEKVKETWESGTDSSNSITHNTWHVWFLSIWFLRVVTVLNIS